MFNDITPTALVDSHQLALLNIKLPLCLYNPFMKAIFTQGFTFVSFGDSFLFKFDDVVQFFT